MKRPSVNASVAVCGFVLAAVVALGCAHKKIVVEIPPRIDLQPYQTIGIMEMSSNSTDALNQLATQRFISEIQGAQPQVRFLELGAQEHVLRAVGRDRLDPDALKALGKKYGVTTIFSGSYELSELKPKVTVGDDLSSLSASASVSVAMVAKHWDTATGATLWTNSRRGQWPVASVSKDSRSPISFSLSVPEDRYGQFIGKLVYAVTDDFRPHYETRKVPKQ
jgi:hypothetical protein